MGIPFDLGNLPINYNWLPNWITGMYMPSSGNVQCHVPLSGFPIYPSGGSIGASGVFIGGIGSGYGTQFKEPPDIPFDNDYLI